MARRAVVGAGLGAVVAARGLAQVSDESAVEAAVDAGVYVATVTNAVGSASSASATLTVTVLLTPPTITTGPVAVVGAPGGSATEMAPAWRFQSPVIASRCARTGRWASSPSSTSAGPTS